MTCHTLNHSVRRPAPKGPPRAHVIALHCSGADAGQWRGLAEALGRGTTLIAPEHFGTEKTGPWPGDGAFTLEKEAERSIQLLDTIPSKVHLVGHSYGGGVALHVAHARPDKIASLSLYEPSAFHLLKTGPFRNGAAFSEIATVAQALGAGVLSGDYDGAMEGFVDYWNGEGAWRAMKPSLREALRHLAPKVALDFTALFDEKMPSDAYRALDMPILILRGGHALYPSRSVVERLLRVLPHARLEVVEGAGHMGPITHAERVNGAIVQHMLAAEPAKAGAA